MIKAVLLDLDDTLLQGNTWTFFDAYLNLLGQAASDLAEPKTFVKQVMNSYQQSLEIYNPAATLQERFMSIFMENIELEVDAKELQSFFDTFYTRQYATLQGLDYIHPQAGSGELLDWLFEREFLVVIATNPGLPEAAIHHRMTWGEVDPDRYPYKLITGLETMHFGKPQPEYYAEILVRLDIDPAEAIMVGDDWERDIVSAAGVGMNTYWVSLDGSPPPDPAVPLDGYGSFESFVHKVSSGWLDTVQPHQLDHRAVIHSLAAFPAAIDVLRRAYSSEMLERCPAKKEWSSRDIVCHLIDHETQEDRARLERILAEDNPFLSANYDPWAHAHEYAQVPFDRAFNDFVRYRAETVNWLRSLPEAVWARPARHSIFGPTTFEEMVRFIRSHDRTHLRQVHEAICCALRSKGLG
jgi:FMN phosphatase YigB (HAD superfamily)